MAQPGHAAADLRAGAVHQHPAPGAVDRADRAAGKRDRQPGFAAPVGRAAAVRPGAPGRAAVGGAGRRVHAAALRRAGLLPGRGHPLDRRDDRRWDFHLAAGREPARANPGADWRDRRRGRRLSAGAAGRRTGRRRRAGRRPGAGARPGRAGAGALHAALCRAGRGEALPPGFDRRVRWPIEIKNFRLLQV